MTASTNDVNELEKIVLAEDREAYLNERFNPGEKHGLISRILGRDVVNNEDFNFHMALLSQIRAIETGGNVSSSALSKYEKYSENSYYTRTNYNSLLFRQNLLQFDASSNGARRDILKRF